MLPKHITHGINVYLPKFGWFIFSFCCSSPMGPSWDVEIDADQDRMDNGSTKSNRSIPWKLHVATIWKRVGLLLDHDKPLVSEMVNLVSTDVLKKPVVNVLTLRAGTIEILLCSMRFWKLNQIPNPNPNCLGSLNFQQEHTPKKWYFY